MRIYFTVLTGVLGLAFGSFLNVCLSRWPAGESVAKPRSHCRACGRTLTWWENVPLLSWLALRGRCRTCGVWIGWRYPLVEFSIGAGWALIAAQNLPTDFSRVPAYIIGYQAFVGLGQMLFFWMLVLLAGLDAENLWLPDRVTVPGIGIGALFHIASAVLIAFSPIHDTVTGTDTVWYELKPVLWRLLVGIFISAGLVLFIRWFYQLIRHREGIGLGDAKLMAMLGAWLGLQGALLAFALGILMGAAVGVVVLARGARAGTKNPALGKLPLGTFLCIGGIVSSLWGQQILAAYMRWAGF